MKTQQDRPAAIEFIGLGELQRRMAGRSRASIYRDVKRGRLPRPVTFGSVNYWIATEIDAAMLSMAEVHRSPVGVE